MRLSRGFSLVEMAVVLFIVALLLGGVILTLSAQEDARSTAETRRRLEAAADAVIGFAIANKRLPCPATGATGVESGSTLPGQWDNTSTNKGGICANNFSGFLPARTLGFQPVDLQGFAVDAWGNRIRYAVARAVVASTCSAGTPHFTSVDNLKANGVGCRPNDLVVCRSSDVSTGMNPSANPPTCGASTNIITNQETVAFILHAAGKNGIGGAANGADETANANGDAVFIYREHGTIETGTGIYDDMLLWVPAGVVYSKLISAGVLP